MSESCRGARWGAGMFVWPHGLHVDRDGNIWATDGTVANNEPQLAKKLKPALEAGYGHAGEVYRRNLKKFVFTQDARR